MSDLICTCLTKSDHPSVVHMDHCEWKQRERSLDDTATVLVFRNANGQPVAVPEAVVVEAERPYRSYQLHMQGKSWAAIAKEESYADAAAARYDVGRYIEEGKALVVTESRRNQLQLEVARLDYAQSVIWAQMETGHLPAVKEVVNIIMSRAKLLALAEMAENEGGEDGPTTVIVPNGDEYELELRKQAGESAS